MLYVIKKVKEWVKKVYSTRYRKVIVKEQIFTSYDAKNFKFNFRPMENLLFPQNVRMAKYTQQKKFRVQWLNIEWI